MLTKIAGRLQSPVFFLAFANLFSAIIGFFSGMLTARWLGSEAYGVMGIIAAINITALNFVDLRLSDVMAKLYFKKDPPTGMSVQDFRASLIQSSLICYSGLAAVFLVLGMIATYLLSRFFTTMPIQWTWIAASAAGMSVTYLVNPIGSMQRLTGRFRLLGWQAMAGSVLSSGIMLLCIFRNRDLDGYYLGFALSNCAGAGLAVGIALFVWVRLDGLPILSRLDLRALKTIRGQSRFLFWGNILGYFKLGHRSADVLLVGYFCDDNITGLYKLARTLTDKFNMLFDAMNQVYFPTFMKMLSQESTAAYRRLATRILLAVFAFTLVVLAVEYVTLPYFVDLILKGKFEGAEPAIITMTIPFFFLTGMYIWMWPLVLHYGLVGRYTLFTGLALLVQIGLGIGLFKINRDLSAFTLGYVGHYLTLILLTGALIHRRYREFTPFGRASAKGRE